MNTRYDVAIIGCGEAGIFAGYELKKLRPELKVLALDQGRGHLHPQLPHRGRQGGRECIHCSSLRHHVRLRRRRSLLRRQVQLHHRLRRLAHRLYGPATEVMDLIRLCGLASTSASARPPSVFSTDTPEAQALEKKALEHDLHLLQARCKHLGTENNLRILARTSMRTCKDKMRVPLPHRGQDHRPAGRGLPPDAGERRQRWTAPS